MYSFPPASVATGFPRWLNSVSSSMMDLLMRDWRPGIQDLITCTKCFQSTFPKCSEPILWERCWYSGVLEKYSRSRRRAEIILSFLLISAWDRLTTPIQGNCNLYEQKMKSHLKVNPTQGLNHTTSKGSYILRDLVYSKGALHAFNLCRENTKLILSYHNIKFSKPK